MGRLVASSVDRVALVTPIIAVPSIGYRTLGSRPRAAGWSAATSCLGPPPPISALHKVGRLAGVLRTYRSCYRHSYFELAVEVSKMKVEFFDREDRTNPLNGTE